MGGIQMLAQKNTQQGAAGHRPSSPSQGVRAVFRRCCRLAGRRESPERGTTLLEILVVAVVLLVGILTVIRVFPVGFDVVERAGYVTLANRYCQTWLSELSANPAALPDGILPAVYVSPTQGWPVNDDRLRPTDLEGVPPAGGGLRELRNSLVQFRKMHGVTLRVPHPGAQPTARVILPFAPIEYYEGANFYDLLTVYSLQPYYRVDIDDLPRYQNRDGYYAIDPDEEEDPSATVRTLYFSQVPYPRTFKLDYALQTVGGANPDSESLTQRVIAIAANDTQGVQLGGPGLAFIWGSETIRRRFRDANAEPANADPYWYSLRDRTVGLLEFSDSTAGIPVGIDYSVMDWQILHDDVEVPLMPDPGQDAVLTDPADQLAWVRLSFPFIVRDAPIGSAADPRPAMQDPIIIQNIDPNSPGYGEVIDVGGTDGSGKPTWTFDDPVRGTDTSLAGRIGLRVARFNQPGNEIRRIRIFYRTRDGFAAQVLKPYAVYLNAERDASGGVPEPRFDRFVLIPAGSDWWLYFALCDVGKAVSVDYTYEAGDALRKVVGEMHTITETYDNARRKAYGMVRLNVPGGGRIRSIDSVRGMSLEVRVIWPQRGEPNQTYDILSMGWSGATPEFWKDGEKGLLLVQSASAAVAKPRDL